MVTKTNVTVSTTTREQFLSDLKAYHADPAAFLDSLIGSDEVEEAPAKPAAKKAAPAKAPAKKAAAKPEPEDDEDEDDEEADEEDDQSERRAELSKKTVAALKKIAIQAGFDKEDVADADKETLIESILGDEAEKEDADEEDEDEEETEDEAEESEEGDEYTRDDLEAMTLTALKKVAREEYELTAADIKGLDKDSLIDYLLGESEEDEEESEDEEDDEEGYTKEDLDAMSLKDLVALAKEYEVPGIKPGLSKTVLVKKILAAFEE